MLRAVCLASFLAVTLHLQPAIAETERSIVLGLDASGSMNAKLPEGVARIDAAKTALADLVGKLADNTRLAQGYPAGEITGRAPSKPAGGDPAAERAGMEQMLLGRYRARIKATKPTKTRNAGRVGQQISPNGVLKPKASDAKGKQAMPVDPDVFVSDPCKTPQIKTTDAPMPLDPGDSFIVNGCGFTKQQPGDELRLAGDFPANFVKLQVSEWKPWLIRATVPPELTGLKDDKQARLQVVLKDGHISKPITVGFRARREVRQLSRSDVSPNCFQSALNDCTLGSSTFSKIAGKFKGATFAARHRGYKPDSLANCKKAQLGNNIDGTDSISATLKNGWVFAGAAWWWWSENDAGGVAWNLGLPPDFASGSKTIATAKVGWRVVTYDCPKPGKSGRMSLRVDLWVIGPAGVPYK